MGQKYCKPATVAILIGIILFVAGCAESHRAKDAKSASTKSGEIERKVTAEEVPEAALTALKRMARRAEITEFMAVNSNTLADEDGDYSGWVEIYNSGWVPKSLEGWYLTNDQGDLTKWQFPAVNVMSGGFL